MYDILELNKKLLAELKDVAKELDIKRIDSFKKQDLIYKILDEQAIVASGKIAEKGSERKNPKRARVQKVQKAIAEARLHQQTHRLKKT